MADLTLTKKSSEIRSHAEDAQQPSQTARHLLTTDSQQQIS